MLERRRIVIRVRYLLLVLLSLTTASASHYRFVTLSDVHCDESISRQYLRTAITTIRRFFPQPQFLIFTGDAFKADTDDSLILERSWQEWQAELSALGAIPIFSALGNHEANLGHQWDGEKFFKKYWPQLPSNGPVSMLGLAYYFDWEDERFIVLNTNSRILGYQLGEEQFQWLQSVLEDATGRQVFIAGHLPAFEYNGWRYGSLASNPQERDRFWSLLERYHVLAYICGHIHTWNHDGFGRLAGTPPPFQVVQGSFGFKEAADQFPHFVVWDIDGPMVKAQAFTPEGFFIDGFQWDGMRKTEIGPDLRTLQRRACSVPNPCREFLNILLDTQGGKLEEYLDVRIYNMIGQLVAQPRSYHTSNRILLYLRPLNLASGNYICVINLPNGQSLRTIFTSIH